MQVAEKLFTERTDMLRAAQDLPTPVTTCGRREHGPKSPKFENPGLGHYHMTVSTTEPTLENHWSEEGSRRMLPW